MMIFCMIMIMIIIIVMFIICGSVQLASIRDMSIFLFTFWGV